MTVQTYEHPTPVVTFVGAASIEATARALVDAHKIGTALCRTAFVPKHFQGKPDDAAAAILYGSTIDMDPVTALQNIYVISGKPALYARTMVAIVLSKGHEVWTEEESDGSVTVAGRRKGSEQVERVTWTTAMAQTAGYLSNANYKSNSRAMLYARASGDVARRIAPDALLGMAHNVEELTLERPVQAERPVTAGRARLADALGTTTAEQVHEPDPAPTEDGVLLDVRSALAKRMFATFNDSDVPEAERITWISDVIGRDITSTKEMTEAEAGTTIDALEARNAEANP